MKPLRCMLGRHTGQKQGGTMMFLCPRCGGSYWQTKDFSAVTRRADFLIRTGHAEEGRELARKAVERDA